MRFVYHPDLIEQAVFLITRKDASRECELHARVDRLYAIADPESRNAAFAESYSELFAEWKLADQFQSQVRHLLGKCDLERCALAPAGRRKDQKIDLLLDSNSAHRERTLFILITPESLLDPIPLIPWMRRELLQVADMLDEHFGYKPDDIIGTPWERKLRQDRYLVLWRIYVAGRLHRAGSGDSAELHSIRTSFQRAFRYRGAEPAAESFDRVFQAEELTHQQLLGWATEPQSVLRESADIVADAPGPGALCPLCGFPTHDWFDLENGKARKFLSAIRETHPQWRRDNGACRQCVETYMTRIGGVDLSIDESVGEQHEDCIQETLGCP